MVAFNNILFPINLDAEDLSYVKKVFDISIGFKGRLHILYVNDEQAGYRHPTDREDAVALRVEEVIPKDTLNSMQVVYAVSKGNLADEIKAYCKKNSIDLIITGHKHRGKLYSAMFDTPDENIIDAVNVPVFIIPE